MTVFFFLIYMGTWDQVRQANYLRFEPMAESLGLAQHSVRSMLQDKDGYLWLGTYEGLHRLDGYQVTLFGPETSPQTIGDDRVPCLFQDAGGQIWAGTATNGLWFYRGQHHGFEKVPGIEGCVRHVQATRQGSLLVGGCDGLFLVSDKKIQHHWFAGQSVTALTAGEQDQCWVGVGRQLFRLNLDTMETESMGEHPQILALNNAVAETLWIGTEEGLYRRHVQTGSQSVLTIAGDTKPAPVVDLFADSQGHLWIATRGAGILVKRNDRDGFDQFRHGAGDVSGLGDNFIDFVREDAFGALWVTSSSSGVFQRIAPDGLDMYFFRAAETGKNGVHCFEEVGDQIWVGTQKGLWHLDEDTYGPKDIGIGNQPIRHIEVVGSDIWLATRNGAYQLDQQGKIKQHFTQEDGLSKLSHNLVRTMLLDRAGDLWLGTRDGLNLFRQQTKRFEVFAEVDGLTNASVFALHQHGDDLWIGTYRGLFRMHLPSRRIQPWRMDGQTLSSGVTAIQTDGAGAMWIGTHGKGLYRVNPDGQVQVWRKEDGLGSNVVYGIQCDSQGTAWVSTNQGIVAIAANGNMTNYRAHSGLQGNEFNAGAHYQDAAGHLYFGGLLGMNRFHPQKFQPQIKPPNASITEVALLQEDGTFKAVEGHEMTMKFKDFKGVRISFSSFQFLQPEAAQYAYKLNETEPWTQVGNSHRVLLTSLEPGAYVVRAKGSDMHGQWRESPAQFQLSLKPPFYKTLAFQIPALVMLVLLVNLGYVLFRRLLRLVAHWKKTSFVGPYKILEKVGAGGMSEVYRARNIHNQDTVALKVLHMDMSEASRQRFFRESLICETLNHPNVVKVLAKGEHNDQCYLALEYIQGQTLAAYFEAQKPSLQFTVFLFQCLIEILSEMHEQGVVHRDLKPENIMLDHRVKAGRVDGVNLKAHIRILDFGISKLVEDTFTQTSYFMGTLMYLPPEVLLNSDQSTGSNYDFYSLAMTFHQLITGHRPYSGEHAFEIIGQVLNKNTVHLHHWYGQVPVAFADLIEAMTAKDPQERLTDAAIILQRCGEIPQSFFEQVTPLQPQDEKQDPVAHQKRLYEAMAKLSGMSESQQQAYLETISRQTPAFAAELRELVAISPDALDDALGHPLESPNR